MPDPEAKGGSLGNGSGLTEEYVATFNKMSVRPELPPSPPPGKGKHWHKQPDVIAVPATPRLREGLTRYRLTLPDLKEGDAAAKLIEERLVQIGDLKPEGR